jgi:hypothetical protein
MDVCRRVKPPTVQVAGGHAAACWLHVDPADREAHETRGTTPVAAGSGDGQEG